MNIPRRLAVVVLVLGLIAAACGADEPAAPTAPPTTAAPVTTTAAPATTVAPTATAAPTTAVASFPVTVAAGNGDVEIPVRPERIVSLAGTHTEMLYALGAGDQVAGTDLYSNYPAAAADTSKVDAFNFSVEEVAALDPDLVILSFDFGDTGAQLDTVGIPYLLLEAPATLEGTYDQLEILGAATGRLPEATELVASLRDRVAAIERRAAPLGGVTFFHEVDDTLYSTTSASFLGDVYARLGLVNIADAVGGDNPFPQLSPEYILEQDPWLVFLGDANFGVTVEAVAARPGWSVLTAVQNGAVFPLDGDLAGRWGPRLVDLMESILDAALETVP